MSEYWDGDINWISPKDMKVDEVTDSLDKVTTFAVEDYGLKQYNSPNVVIVIRGMILARYVPVSVASGTYTINQDMKVMRSKGAIAPWYLQMYLAAIRSYLMTLIAEAGHGTKALRTDVLMDTPILLPPEQEQKSIIALIKDRKERLDSVTAKVTQFISSLTEYRAALITSAVTGPVEGLR
jgi:type I restriction enzyme S subunit